MAGKSKHRQKKREHKECGNALREIVFCHSECLFDYLVLMRISTLLRLCEPFMLTPELPRGGIAVKRGKKLKKKPNMIVVMLTLESIFFIAVY